jgi:hypothetical protein
MVDGTRSDGLLIFHGPVTTGDLQGSAAVCALWAGAATLSS